MIPIHKRILGEDYEILLARGNDGLQLELRGEHVDELARILARALDTCDPHKSPECANELCTALETR